MYSSPEVMGYIFESYMHIGATIKIMKKKQLIIKQVYDLFGEEADYQYGPPKVFIEMNMVRNIILIVDKIITSLFK
jgi:hypothetical protein